jgi:acylphosphatase
MTNGEQGTGAAAARLTARVSGYVQGVGFRWSTMSVANDLGLLGYAQNQYNGDVLVVAEGPREACERLLGWLRGEAPGAVRLPGRVSGVSPSWGSATGEFRRFNAY